MPNFRAHIHVTAALLVIVAAVTAACDDDDADDPTPTTSIAATAPVVDPTAAATLAVPTADPERTPGPPGSIELLADPSRMVCDGETPSTVTAVVLDGDGQPVQDGTEVRFDVVAIGSADPVTDETEGGVASTEVTSLGEGVGVAVNVSAGNAAASTRIDCE
jgi:hypothetical protein